MTTGPTAHNHTATIFQGEDGDWHWHVKAANNEIISEGEGYTRRHNAVHGLVTAHPEFAGMDLANNESATISL